MAFQGQGSNNHNHQGGTPRPISAIMTATAMERIKDKSGSRCSARAEAEWERKTLHCPWRRDSESGIKRGIRSTLPPGAVHEQ